MKQQYDAVVIGAGPAGSRAALEIAQKGYSVLLLEKRKKPGTPLCCAEAVSRPSFEKSIKPKEKWISSRIEKIQLIAPDKNKLTIHHPEAGYILDRQQMDSDLAQEVVDAGGELVCDTIGMKLNKNDELFNSIEILQSPDKRMTIMAKIFVAADGVESRIARLSGINNLLDIDEVESLLQYRLEDISIIPDTIEFHVGNQVAPGGYLWVFPKSANSANVGLGLTGDTTRGELCRTLLDRFIAHRFKSPRIAFKSCGVTPKYKGKKLFRIKNLLVAGDAARTLDSLSGAGIINALLSGKFAGMAAAEYLSGQFSHVDQIEKSYPGRFFNMKGEELKLYNKLRKVYIHLDDDDFSDIGKALSEQFVDGKTEGVNAGKLLSEIIRTRPRLLRLVRYLL